MVRNPCEWLPVPAREGKHALCRPAVAVEDGRGVKRRDLVFDERVVRAAQNDAAERAPRKMAGKGKRLPFRDETLHGGGEAGRGKDGEAFPFAGEESAETGALRRAGRDEDERMFAARALGKADGGFRPDDGKGKGAAHLFHARRSRRVARKDGGVNAQRLKNLQPLPHIGGDLLFRPAPVGSMRFVRKIKIPHAVRKAQALEEDPEAARAAVEYADAHSLRHALPPRKNPRKNVRIPAKTVYNQCILC